MELGGLAQRLDRRFDVHRHVELAGWDFALSPADVDHLLGRGSATFRSTFNGLLPLGDPERSIDRVYLVVFPAASLLENIIERERERQGASSLIVTHHPCDMETRDRGFLAIDRHLLDELAAHDIGLYVLHAPLDCDPEISTGGALAAGLDLRIVERFAPYAGGMTGVIAEQRPEPFDAFAERVRTLCEIPHIMASQTRFAGRLVQRVAIVAGGGDDVTQLGEAEGLGADTYLAGHWWTPHRGEWPDQNRKLLAQYLPECRMNLLSASHDGSELVVFRDFLVPLFADWRLDATLLRQPDHWR